MVQLLNGMIKNTYRIILYYTPQDPDKLIKGGSSCIRLQPAVLHYLQSVYENISSVSAIKCMCFLLFVLEYLCIAQFRSVLLKLTPDRDRAKMGSGRTTGFRSKDPIENV